jgi:hypothetical protein
MLCIVHIQEVQSLILILKAACLEQDPSVIFLSPPGKCRDSSLYVP